MKKLLAVTGAILIAYLILTAVVPGRNQAPAAEAANSEPSVTAGVYTVTDDGGRIAVYRSGKLYKSTDTPTASLPKADRVKLEKGIEVYSDAELKRLLEDYCS